MPLQKAIQNIAKALKLSHNQVQRTISLLDEGATIPFISRYRKEQTGSLDEVQISQIRDLWQNNIALEKRKESIISSIQDQGKLTEALKNSIINCDSITILEDIYLPFKIKRKTKASIAKEHGLEPLANYILSQVNGSLIDKAKTFLNKEITTTEEALQGARDIIAEKINEDQQARTTIRQLFEKEAIITSKVIKTKAGEGVKFSDYFDYNEKLNKCPSHRILALMRGEEEGFLRVNIEPDFNKAISLLERIFIKTRNQSGTEISLAISDSYKRLLGPSIETEYRNITKAKADQGAIEVFADNLKQLLLAAPLGPKKTLAIDPGFKSGCKLVCLDEQGNLLHNENIYPHAPQLDTKKASAKIYQLVEAYKIEAIAIGNGTAGRETESFIQRIKFNKDIQIYIVNESGASIYSASAAAREEFPDYDVTVRGAVSIGRRLMDPLAELVKIDPKSIGVGQYQHDVDQNKLKNSLDLVVESAVNMVGVNLNTASKHLLTYVSGLGPQLAQNIVDYRKEHGGFTNREQLKKIPRLGSKAFEQCAGFLRIRGAENPLDNTAVHPESYRTVEQMAKNLKCSIKDLILDESNRKKINLSDYVTKEIGLPTLEDIMKELAKPGLDPRKKLKAFEFAPGITKPEHLALGMNLPGIVTNITAFGAFVDIGVKQDGLVHVSNLANQYVSNPAEVIKINQQVTVRVIDLDLSRKRIGLSMKDV